MRLPVEVLSPAEVRSLINACSNRAPKGIRNRALIAVLYRCGLRIGEALALMPKDLDEKAGRSGYCVGRATRRVLWVWSTSASD